MRIALFALAAGLVLGQSFEAATLKLNTVAQQNTVTVLPGGERLRVRNFPLLWLIGAAYRVPNLQIEGLPKEMATECYDIEAKAEHKSTRDQMMRMLQSLLEERFKLTVRRETKELKAQVLIVMKGGPKLDENQDGADLLMDRAGRSKWRFHNMPMSMFANVLSNWVGDTVVDGTGLSGNYDFTVEALLEGTGPGVREGRELGPDPNAPSVYKAVQEQLGLKLESRKGPVEMVVIDHIEKPSGN
jgi:bla regulator protein blaR1